MEYRLINNIGEYLGILDVDNPNWLINVIYSLAGRQALASLWDTPDADLDISIVHFKESILKSLYAYAAMFPQVSSAIGDQMDDLCNRIYSIYLRTGHFYHSSNRLAPVIHTVAPANGLFFHRGISPSERCSMSGLGYYSRTLTSEVKELSVQEMFEISFQDERKFVNGVLAEEGWAKIQWPDNTEFLNLNPHGPKKGYWLATPTMSGDLSLARFRDTQVFYVLYFYSQGLFWYKPLPERFAINFRTKYADFSPTGNSRYYNIANALLLKYGTLPHVNARIKGKYVVLKLEYMLPVELGDLIDLYSWPAHYAKLDDPFTKELSLPVYQAIKTLLEQNDIPVLEV